MTKEISAMRERITSIKRELAGLRSGNTNVTKATALDRVNAFIDWHASEGQKSIHLFCAQQMNLDPGTNPTLFPAHRADSVRIALASEQIRAALHAEVERQYSEADDGIEPAAVPARIDALESELLALEQREFAAAIKAGIAPRHDTSPAVLLGLA